MSQPRRYWDADYSSLPPLEQATQDRLPPHYTPLSQLAQEQSWPKSPTPPATDFTDVDEVPNTPEHELDIEYLLRDFPEYTPPLEALNLAQLAAEGKRQARERGRREGVYAPDSDEEDAKKTTAPQPRRKPIRSLHQRHPYNP